MNKNKEFTLGPKQKEFEWYVNGNNLNIIKKIKCGEILKDILIIFTYQELLNIIKFTKNQEVVTLSNDLSKMKNIVDEKYVSNEYYSKGLGPFVYKYTEDNSKSQAVSQIVAIFVKQDIFNYKKSRSMVFWVNEDAIEKLNNLFSL